MVLGYWLLLVPAYLDGFTREGIVTLCDHSLCTLLCVCHTSVCIKSERPPTQVSLVVFPPSLLHLSRTAAHPGGHAHHAPFSHASQSSANLLDASPLPPARCPPGLLPGLSCAHPPSPHSVLRNGSHSNHCWTYNSSPYKCAPKPSQPSSGLRLLRGLAPLLSRSLTQRPRSHAPLSLHHLQSCSIPFTPR